MDSLVRALGAALPEADSTESWNAAVARDGVRREEALQALLRAGEALLGESDHVCPLCEEPQDAGELSGAVSERARQLALSQRELAEAREAIPPGSWLRRRSQVPWPVC